MIVWLPYFAVEREFSAIRPGVQSYPQEYALHSAFTLCKLLHLSILLRYLAKEIKLIHRKSDVNLEWLTLRHLQSLFVCNDQIISSSIAVFQRFQIKLATESTLCTIIACLICNNLLNITNLPAIFIRKVNLIDSCFTVGTNSILLIEIQRKIILLILRFADNRLTVTGFVSYFCLLRLYSIESLRR